MTRLPVVLVAVVAAVGVACAAVLTVVTLRYRSEVSSFVDERQGLCRRLGRSLASFSHELERSRMTGPIALHDMVGYCLPQDQDYEAAARGFLRAAGAILSEGDYESARREYLEIADALAGEPVPRLEPVRIPPGE